LDPVSGAGDMASVLAHRSYDGWSLGILVQYEVLVDSAFGMVASMAENSTGFAWGVGDGVGTKESSFTDGAVSDVHQAFDDGATIKFLVIVAIVTGKS
jgi:hypothetical protein